MKSLVGATDATPYMEAMKRMLRAAGRRVAKGDPDDLAQLLELRATLEEAIGDGVTGLRDQGVTWEGIGEAMGITRQAALMKWGKRAAS